MTVKQMERCRQRLQAYLAEMLTPLGRSERRYWGSVYVRGLLLDGERKSVGAMATPRACRTPTSRTCSSS
jgi:SRSO17 transposase